MAFNLANLSLSLVDGAHARFSVLNYTTSDNLATVRGSSYFEDAKMAIRAGDIIKVSASDGDDRGLVDAAYPGSPYTLSINWGSLD